MTVTILFSLPLFTELDRDLNMRVLLFGCKNSSMRK
jgi:hypothetical protein